MSVDLTDEQRALTAALESPAQRAMADAHFAAGRPSLALMVAGMAPEHFEEADRAMEAAFVLGMATAMNAKR